MATPTGILFSDPRVKPLSTTGQPQSGCYYCFFSTNTTTLTNVYADATLLTPLSQPTPGSVSPVAGTVAAADGRFVPIYMDPNVTYRAQLYSAAGVLLEDTDPYVVPAVSAAAIGALLYPRTAAEISAFLTPTTYIYPQGDLRRYGIAPNNTSAAVANAAALTALLNAGAVGPTGPIVSPNTTGADIYYFTFTNSAVQIRPGVVIDLNGSTWNFAGSFAAGYSNLGFLMANAKVTIRNGTIIANATGAAPACAIQLGWRDANTLIPALYDATFLAVNGYTLGDIHLQHLNIFYNTTTGVASAAMQALGGLQNVTIDNVWIDGSSNANSAYGTYYEFGWATTETSRYQRQTSHANNWNVTNFKVTNLAASGSIAFGSNGGYNFRFNNVYVSRAASIFNFGTGESLFLNPWIGHDDIGSLAQMPQNGSNLTGTSAAGRMITMRNIVGRGITASAIVGQGSVHPGGWISSGTVQAWLPGHTYVLNQFVYNGTYEYKLTTLGTGVSESSTPYRGPTGTSTSTDANGLVWTYQAAAYSTGYRGWQRVQYAVGDIAINGQYAYVCTQINSAVTASQGPTGIGTAISDGLGGLWSSIPVSGSATSFSPTGVPNSWVACANQLNFDIDGFDIDGTSAGFGLWFYSSFTARNGKLSNFSRGLVATYDAIFQRAENVEIINCTGTFGVQIGFGNSVWGAPRLATGLISGCRIVGTSVSGATGGYGITMSQVGNYRISDNRIGYDFARDGVAEINQTNGIVLPVSTSSLGQNSTGLVCANNQVATAVGTTGTGLAYQLYAGYGLANCVLENPLGSDVSYTGPWEGQLQTGTCTITCTTLGNLAVAYTTQQFAYIKRGQEVRYRFNIVTSSFTWTTSTGNLQISGLPFPVVSNVRDTGSLSFQGITKAGYTQFTHRPVENASIMLINAQGSGSALATCQIADAPTAGSVILQGSGAYITTN